jgi:hypothetical protein
MPENLLQNNLPPQSEQEASREQFLGLIAGIANHEAKLAVTALITSQPEEWFGESSLWKEVKDRQGAQIGWLPDRKGPVKYCVNSLGPVGLVVKGTIAGERGEVTAFTANDDEPELVSQGLALSGALLEWSLKNPDISLQKIFGATAAKGSFRTPVVRLGVIKTLANSDSETLTYNQIAQPIISDEVNEHNVYSSIRELRDVGILQTKLIDTADDVRLEITAPYSYRGAGLRFDQLTEPAKLAHKALDTLWANGQRVISFKELADTALTIDPGADLVKLRAQWQYGVSEDTTNMPNLKVAERTMDAVSSVKINPEYAEAIKDLVDRLDDIEAGVQLDTYQEAAKRITGTPTAMATLFAKAKKFSSNVSGQEEGLEVVEQRIISIVAGSDAITARGIFKALEASGRPMTEGRITSYLGRMAKNGVLNQERRQLDPSKSRQYNFYSVPLSD